MNTAVKNFRPTRRALVVSSALAGGALLVGCKPGDMLSLGAAKEDFGPFGPFIRIDPDGWVTVVNKHIEVGQGSHAGQRRGHHQRPAGGAEVFHWGVHRRGLRRSPPRPRP